MNGNATDLDFDSFGNLYVGGNGSLIDVVDIQDNDGLTSGVTQAVDLDSLDIVAMRVFSDFLYILPIMLHLIKQFIGWQFLTAKVRLVD